MHVLCILSPHEDNKLPTSSQVAKFEFEFTLENVLAICLVHFDSNWSMNTLTEY